MNTALQMKAIVAEDILKQCIGDNGVHADPSRYRGQCWTRDLVIAAMPMLIATGQSDVVSKHLASLSRKQRHNGQIPILFLDRTWPFLRDKITKSLRDGKISFMLARYLKGQLWNLTPGTRDSEILYIIGMYEYANQTGDQTLLNRYMPNIHKALAYVEHTLVNSDGLVIGCDWRDTMERLLGDTALLSNNSLLYRAYCLMGETEKAALLRERINRAFWKDDGYVDYRGAHRFDPLGTAFAVLYGVIPEERYAVVLQQFSSVDSKCGITIQCRHNPTSNEEGQVIERTNGVVTWPFAIGFSILALLKMGDRSRAEEQFEKLLTLDGFREWYDPASGMGYGAYAQLWSAVLFWRSMKALHPM